MCLIVKVGICIFTIGAYGKIIQKFSFFSLTPPETARNLKKSTAMSSFECPLFRMIGY